MPFVYPLIRKRARSHSNCQSRSGFKRKIPRLDLFFHDVTSSQQSIESSPSSLAMKAKGQWKRGVSSIKSCLVVGDKPENSKENITDQVEDLCSTPTAAPLQAISVASMNDPLTTKQTIQKGLLITLDQPHGGSKDKRNSDTTIYASEYLMARCTGIDPYATEDSKELQHVHFPALYRSQSTPKLQQHLLKFWHYNGNPTVIRRPELISRPSIQTLNLTAGSSHDDDEASEKFSICCQAPDSTAPDNQSDSEDSIRRYVTIPLNGTTPKNFTESTDNGKRPTSLIPADSTTSKWSILTTEAASSAKIFLELQFNQLLNYIEPRALRRRALELKLRSLQLPACIQDRARNRWLRNENETLRCERILNSRSQDTHNGKGIFINGYEVVKILGKGSFGVVRLVKEKVDPKIASATVIENQVKKKSSLTAIKSSARQVLSPLSSRRRELTRTKREVYAMKVIRKSDMIRNGQEGHIRAERDFLVAARDSRWVITLIAAFQDRRFLYLVMDYCIGGDFLGLLIRRNTLSEEVTKWYIAEMILCVEEAHKMKWIHRDIKPDNFLIEANGHLKISDFGLAFDGDWSHDQKFYTQQRHNLIEKLGIIIEGDEQDRKDAKQEKCKSTTTNVVGPDRSKILLAKNERDEGTESVLDWRNREQKRRLARSVVGTSQYMAPEVIRGELYDGRCDWWSIAIIMYESLYGFTPFACGDRQNTKLTILRHKDTFAYPKCEPRLQPSREARDLMSRILVEREQRLCSRKYELNDFTKKVSGNRVTLYPADRSHRNYAGYFVYPDDAEDIKKHPFFSNINWNTIHLKKPPFIPKVKSWEDTKYFDEEEPVSDIGDSSSFEEQVMNVSATNIQRDEATQKHGQHQPEQQHIVPSAAFQLTTKLMSPRAGTPPGIVSASPDGNTLVASDSKITNGIEWKVEKIEEKSDTTERELVKKSKKKERKRPRDKIIRDINSARTATQVRKRTAFLGYSYRRPKTASEVIEEAIEEERKSMLADGY